MITAVGTLWGALQALDAGITTIADWAHNDQSPAHADADLRGLRDSGIRGYFLYGGPGPATDDPNPPHPADARRMRDEYFASGRYGRLQMGMGLRGPAFTSAAATWRTSRSPATSGCRSRSTSAWPAPATPSSTCSATACSGPTSTTCTATS